MKPTTENVLPASYFSWREVCKSENLNMERCQTTAENTYKTLVALSRTMEFPSLKTFAHYYNNYGNSLITDKRYNLWYFHGKLEKIAHLFKLFVADRLTKNGTVVPIVDFGVLKSHYQYYRKHHKPPNVQNRGNTKKNFNDPAENPRTKIEFDNGGTIDVPKNAIYKQFTEGIKAANAASTQKVTIPQMTLVAMQMLMDSRPDVFGQLEQSVAPDSLLTKKSNSRISADISPETTRKMNDTIQRYNSANAVPITQSQFVELAINGLIERIDVKYSDPELAEELKEQEEKA